MPKPLEHDFIRPWLCCKQCKREYDTQLRRANGRPVSVDRLKDGTKSAKRHDDIIDLLLENLHG
jgi:hypothetical protein